MILRSTLPLLQRQHAHFIPATSKVSCKGLNISPNALPCASSNLQCRLLSSSSQNNDLVLSNVNEETGVAMLTMNRPPANSLSLELNEAISTSIKTIETNPNIQSLILTSSNPTIFSAGIDILELVSNDHERIQTFWTSLQQVYIDLYGSRLATIAAMHGHAPAAGCMLAMACDYRIMYAGDGPEEFTIGKKKRHVPTIGMNETKLGIAAPPWMGQLMIRTIGHRPSELALALGTLFVPGDALRIGLVDELVDGGASSVDVSSGSKVSEQLSKLLPESIQGQVNDPLMHKAYQQAVTFAKVLPQARVASKLVARQGPLIEMDTMRKADTDHFLEFITKDEVQKSLRAYLEALKSKSKK